MARNRAAAFLAVLLVVGMLGAAAVSAEEPKPGQQPVVGQTFATPDEAVTALVEALKSEKPDAVAAVLGPGAEKLVASGDKVADAAERRRFLSAYDEAHRLVSEQQGRMTLLVGTGDWPLPIPVIEAAGRWRFDAELGAEELVDRRIGRNEIEAIRTSLAYVDAQKEYFTLTGKSGAARYAMRMLSSPGTHDGLYWPAEGDEESPLGPLVTNAEEEGYPGAQSSGKRQPYHGYFFNILTAQGKNSPQGALNYIANGQMTRGFGLVAWPAIYGASGIMTFIVDQDGIVFQKDLGPQTEAVASRLKVYDPDLSWTRVDVPN